MTPALDDLVDVLQPIGSEISVELAVDLVRLFGGTRLYVPKTWRDGLDINALGLEAAKELCRLFGPERLDIPMTAWRPEALQRTVGELLADGRSTTEIARMLGLSWRTITRYAQGKVRGAPRRDRRTDPRQIDIEELIRKAG